EMIPLSTKKGRTQHIGFGKRLMDEAEKLSKKNGYKKIAVISGIGVRDYYRKLGYQLEDEYMVKKI
ncbi:GNAT family N-acetyltransferase, partial [Patescibacteria group bacterium]|nr:GNAT family N-acetyltransferase [Patescibacteria group bacterium]